MSQKRGCGFWLRLLMVGLVGGQIAIGAAAQSDKIMAVVADDPGFVTMRDAPLPI
jgi:hypothetical protein